METQEIKRSETKPFISHDGKYNGQDTEITNQAFDLDSHPLRKSDHYRWRGFRKWTLVGSLVSVVVGVVTYVVMLAKSISMTAVIVGCIVDWGILGGCVALMPWHLFIVGAIVIAVLVGCMGAYMAKPRYYNQIKNQQNSLTLRQIIETPVLLEGLYLFLFSEKKRCSVCKRDRYSQQNKADFLFLLKVNKMLEAKKFDGLNRDFYDLIKEDIAFDHKNKNDLSVHIPDSRLRQALEYHTGCNNRIDINLSRYKRYKTKQQALEAVQGVILNNYTSDSDFFINSIKSFFLQKRCGHGA